MTATVLLALTSCTEESAVNDSVVSGKIQASFEESISRLSIGEGNSLAWSTGDAFTMFNDAGEHSVWTLEGSGGDVDGVFRGIVPAGTLKGAAFPSTANPVWTGDDLTLTLPAELTYEAGICNLPMWSSFSSLEDNICQMLHRRCPYIFARPKHHLRMNPFQRYNQKDIGFCHCL